MDRESITLEYIFKASPAILYKFLSTPSCLVRWFCDEVQINKDEYRFFWSGSDEVAFLIEDIENELLKFEWEDGEVDEYLEFKISRSPVTGETILHLTDFCDDDEVEDQTQLWNTEMAKLHKEIGG